MHHIFLPFPRRWLSSHLHNHYNKEIADGLSLLCRDTEIPASIERITRGWITATVRVTPGRAYRAATGVILIPLYGFNHITAETWEAWLYITQKMRRAGNYQFNAIEPEYLSTLDRLTYFSILALLVFYAFGSIAKVLSPDGDTASHSMSRSGYWRSTERQYRGSVIIYKRAAICGIASQYDTLSRSHLVARAQSLTLIEREIRKGWKIRNQLHHIPRHERVRLRRHAGAVITVLRTQAALIDENPQTGLRDLGLTLISVAERCAEGRFGALMDEARLQGVSPARDLEALRIVAVALVVGGFAVTAALLNVPAAIAAPLTSAVGAISVAVAYRGAARAGMENLGVLLGGR
ncbi:hypothetical protein [Streptomyces sp. Z26]|uniref:hypothetical protein n=1 Tax=Streptomyces sp. Z26 TaxID=2500177 RepID=UPI000FCA2615|nr:hypothetical protein [Streptomyces sp. Z26]